MIHGYLMVPEDKYLAGPQEGTRLRLLETVRPLPPFLISMSVLHPLLLLSLSSSSCDRNMIFKSSQNFFLMGLVSWRETGLSSPLLPFFPIANVQGRNWTAGPQSCAHSYARHLWPFGERGWCCPIMAFPIITTWMEAWILPDKMGEFSRNQGIGHKTQGPWHIAISQPSLNWGFFINNLNFL